MCCDEVYVPVQPVFNGRGIACTGWGFGRGQTSQRQRLVGVLGCFCLCNAQIMTSSAGEIRTGSDPRPLSAIDKQSYAYKTVAHRMPVILTKVIDQLSRHKIEIYEGKFDPSPVQDNPQTIVKRVPRVLSCEEWDSHRQEIEDELKAVLGSYSKLRNEMQTNKPIPLFVIRADVDRSRFTEDLVKWNEAINGSSAANLLNPAEPPKWFESPWLFIECYMYRRIHQSLQETSFLYTLDPFQWQKAEQLAESSSSIGNMLNYLNNTLEKIAHLEERFSETEKAEFSKLLRLALWGNKGDLSHNNGQVPTNVTGPNQDPHELQHNMRDVILSDNINEIWDHLRSLGNQRPVRIDFICDNYGFELITDLILGEFLLESRIASQIVYHVKAMPWFISDTTERDFYRTLDIVNEHPGKFGDKWRRYLSEGKFQLQVDPFWTLPYSYDRMKTEAPELYTNLSRSDLLIFKGDLNYRKLVGDLDWDTTTPFEVSLRSFRPTALCALRGLKADVVTGLRPGQAEELSKKVPDWMISGHFAVIQFARKAST